MYVGYHVTIASISDPARTSGFFLPGIPASRNEEEYGRLLACAQRSTDFPPIERRIRTLDCRVAGRDCAIEVGQPGPGDGAEVVAIIDLGRHLGYGVFTTADAEAPALLIGKPVYAVTEF